ncbi:RING-H2 finger protein ATL66-like [Henckelia pumila]|uniref:RING-H2 finger protein ATL66-like n=1 Tax=Henckelia pumila TaxID=405737 RepID=UPI003C6DFE8F
MDTTSPMPPSSSFQIRSRYLSAEYNVDSNMQINGTTLFFIGVILLSIIFLLTPIFLCARWAIQRCRNSPPPSNSSTHMASLPPKPTLGLDPVAINDIPVVTYGSTAAEASPGGAECCICLGIYGDEDEVKILPQCRHCFHKECVDEWLKNQSSCPLCRDMLRVGSLV